MVYGQPLIVPGEFFPQLPSTTSCQSAELQSTRWSARQFTPCHPTRHNQKDSYIPDELLTSDNVFVRQDLVKPRSHHHIKDPIKYYSEITKHTNWTLMVEKIGYHWIV